MNITRHNCEAVFLDYYEKNLSPVEVAELLFFLEENSDLKDLFESYEEIHIEQEKINFPDKESFKKKYNSDEIDIILSSEISRNNYEQFFVASIEGVLSAAQIEKLHAFLEQNPELEKEFALFQQCKLPAEKHYFQNKNVLKKESITEQNREEYFVRSIEKNLNLSEQEALNKFVARNPEYSNELEVFKYTVLAADKITFNHKEALKKRERKPVIISIASRQIMYYAAAAAVLFLIGLFFFFSYSDNNSTKQMLADKAGSISKNGDKFQAPSPKNQAPVAKPQEPNVNSSLKKQQLEQKLIPRAGSQEQNINVIIEQSPVTPAPENKELKYQPLITEDNETLIAEKEKDQPVMMDPQFSRSSPDSTVTAEKKQEEGIISQQADEYQTLASFLRKQIRSALGIQQSAACRESDKITAWDLAVLAKNGVQKITGTKAVDISKSCDGGGDKVEYVFVAGNFEISKSVFK